MPDAACPRCGVPLHDQPDYCWSCGFYVGDRWRTTPIGEGAAPEPRVVDPSEVVTSPRTVGGAPRGDPGMARSQSADGARPWVAVAVAVAALVVIGLLALSILGGRSPGADGPSSGPILAVATADAGPRGPVEPSGPTVEGRVERVVDGDTIIVDIGGARSRVRYIGMDTPESVKPDTPVQPFAEDAASANRALVDGRTVTLEKDVSETDPYDRLLRDVWVERDGRLVLAGFELVRAGLANVTTYPPDVRYVDDLVAAQAYAREQGLGIWSASPPP